VGRIEDPTLVGVRQQGVDEQVHEAQHARITRHDVEAAGDGEREVGVVAIVARLLGAALGQVAGAVGAVFARGLSGDAEAEVLPSLQRGTKKLSQN
jgi:hypothetical protein